MATDTSVHTDNASQDLPQRKDRKVNGGTGHGHAESTEAPPPPADDVFADLNALRLDPATSLAGTAEVLIHVPVRKPGRLEFVRTHANHDMALATSIFRDDEERCDYLVPPRIRPLLLGYLKPVQLTATISRQGVLFLWPVPLPDPDATGAGRAQAWGDTARQAAALARDAWLRLKPDMDLGSYRAVLAEGVLPDPIWPEKTLQELMRIGFKDRVIDSADHPIIRKLRGLS